MTHWTGLKILERLKLVPAWLGPIACNSISMVSIVRDLEGRMLKYSPNRESKYPETALRVEATMCTSQRFLADPELAM